ncbi:hypothetical protein BHE74_00015331, partial [Ensete ventricosum]
NIYIYIYIYILLRASPVFGVRELQDVLTVELILITAYCRLWLTELLYTSALRLERRRKLGMVS